jgi:predicted solute-binding protein
VGQSSLPRLGCVKYLNARPLILGWPGEVAFDHPSALCQRLASGELEVALVSSFEFLRNPIYQIVDGVAIASDGPVYSVVVASLPGSRPRTIEVDPASASAVSLLRILLAERAREFVREPMPQDNLAPLKPGQGRFLIGDQAIRFRDKFGETCDYHDLGEMWRRLTNLPFVYALWLIRPEVADPSAIAQRLRKLRDTNLADLDRVIAAEKAFDHIFCRSYYRDHLRFGFGEKEKAGLRRFAQLCVKHGLLPEGELDINLV